MIRQMALEITANICTPNNDSHTHASLRDSTMLRVHVHVGCRRMHVHVYTCTHECTSDGTHVYMYIGTDL